MSIGNTLDFKQPTEYDIKHNLRNYSWNVTLGKDHEPMRVCKIDGCYHTIGGRYGNNCLYVYPRNEEPTVENLTKYNGEIPWSYDVTQTNYYRKDELRCSTKCRIYIAGEQVYEFNCGWDLMPHKIMMTIEELKEHPIYIVEIGYEEKYVLNRKVYFHGKPGIITHYMKEQGSIMINFEDGTGPVKEDILSKSIEWFR